MVSFRLSRAEPGPRPCDNQRMPQSSKQEETGTQRFHVRGPVASWKRPSENAWTAQHCLRPEPDTRNPAAVALSKLGASKGGKARAEKLSARKRREIAKKAASARWRKDLQAVE